MVKYLISIPMTSENEVPDSYFDCGLDKTKVFVYKKHFSNKVCCGHAVDGAASNGHIEIVQILHDFPATKAVDMAARNGHLELIKYLQTHRNEGCTEKAYRSATRTNRFDILKYLLANNCCRIKIFFEDLCLDASGCNNIDMLEFCMDQLHTELTQYSKKLMLQKAAMLGQLETVKWLHEVKGFEWTSTMLQEVKCRGHNAVVRYLNAAGYCENNYDSLLVELFLVVRLNGL
ncbi:hypothetical protein THRCLA_09398 [Thraustotheca clavata]|uniref:Uncharacterized protein n=1 Tax=Thraustotheca clavata TaxID=74557 RepID=A0A1V9YWX2_9STRA|nr:hypothetical protein THRCLA_09398 [Thraustotheca clavata]